MRIRIAAALAVLPLLLGGCAPATVESRASDGDYGAQLQAYEKYSARKPDGSMEDPVKAEYWMQKFAQQRVQYRDLYAVMLINGAFGHVDEERGLAAAMTSAQSSVIAQDIIKTITTMKQDEASDFALWQKLYAETRPFCADRYPHDKDAAVDKTMIAADGGDRYDLLPDAISPGMPNVHAYVFLVRRCQFSLVEQLQDPQAYAVLADWYESPLDAKPGLAAAARALAQQRSGGGADKPKAKTAAKAPALDPADTLTVRSYVLRRYHSLYAAQLDLTQKRQTSACVQALMPVNDFLAQKQYDGVTDTAGKALAGPCASGYDRTIADQYAAYGLTKGGHCGEAITRDLALIHDDTYDSSVEDAVVAYAVECVQTDKLWPRFDEVVTALKVRYPVLAPYTF